MKTNYILLIFLVSVTSYSQSWQWGKRGGGDGQADYAGTQEDIRAIETDAQGNVYLMAPVSNGGLNVDGHALPSYGGDDIVISSFACDGTYRWSTVIGGAFTDFGKSMHVDAQGDVYVIGVPSHGNEFQELFHFDATTTLPYSNQNHKQMFLAKYSGTTGNLLWYRMPQADGLPNADYYNSTFDDFSIEPDGTIDLLALLKDGVYANGQFTNSTPGSTYFVMKYNGGGDFLSAFPLQANLPSTPFRKESTFLRHPTNGNYYAAGTTPTNTTSPLTFNGQAFTSPYFIACFSGTGQFLWVKTLTSFTGIGNRRLYDFKIDTDGYLYITGSGEKADVFDSYVFPSNFTGTRPYLMKLSPTDGSLIWGTSASIDYGDVDGRALTLNGNEVAVSPTYHMLTWGTGYPLVPNGGADASLFRFDKATGTFIDKTKLSSSNGVSEVIGYMTADVFGNYVVGGSFEYDLTVNGTTLLNDGSETDFFVAKYGTANCNLGVGQQEQEPVKLYPNPVKQVLHLSTNQTQGSKTISIYSMLGQQLLSRVCQDQEATLDVSSLAAGTYTIQVTTDKGISTSKFIKE